MLLLRRQASDNLALRRMIAEHDELQATLAARQAALGPAAEMLRVAERGPSGRAREKYAIHSFFIPHS